MRALAGLLLGAGAAALTMQATGAARTGAEAILVAAAMVYAGAVLLMHAWITEKTRREP